MIFKWSVALGTLGSLVKMECTVTRDGERIFYVRILESADATAQERELQGKLGQNSQALNKTF